MARRTKRMDEQANRYLVSRYLDLSSRHAAKGRGERSGKIRSLSTFQRYQQALGQAGKWAWKAYGIRRLDRLTPEMAKAYLDHRRAAGIGQKQLDNDRNALQFVTGKLDRVKALDEGPKASRAYSRDEVERIAIRQHPHHALATRIAYDAGLRAHELHTLRRADEDAPSSSRQWRLDRFLGRSGERYVVTGKEGWPERFCSLTGFLGPWRRVGLMRRVRSAIAISITPRTTTLAAASLGAKALGRVRRPSLVTPWARMVSAMAMRKAALLS